MQLVDQIRQEKAAFHAEQESRKELAAVTKRKAIEDGEIPSDNTA
jgi:hypothetical protein